MLCAECVNQQQQPTGMIQIATKSLPGPTDRKLYIYVWRYVGRYILCCMVTHIISKSMDQPGKVANPARGQLNREN